MPDTDYNNPHHDPDIEGEDDSELPLINLADFVKRRLLTFDYDQEQHRWEALIQQPFRVEGLYYPNAPDYCGVLVKVQLPFPVDSQPVDTDRYLIQASSAPIPAYWFDGTHDGLIDWPALPVGSKLTIQLLGVAGVPVKGTTLTPIAWGKAITQGEFQPYDPDEPEETP